MADILLYLFVICAFTTGAALTIYLNRVVYAQKFEMEKRLNQVANITADASRLVDEELEKPFFDRVIRPFLVWVGTKTQRFVPVTKSENWEKKLVMAGNPWNISAAEFISFQYALTVILGLSALILSLLNGMGFLITAGAAFWGLLFGRFILDTLLNSKIRARQTLLTKALPDVLDLLTVCVEAGLGFDAAMQKVVQKTDGPIADEFHISLQEMKMGKHRREALIGLSERTGSEDLDSFIRAVVQADQMGVPISKVLRIQSDQMRVLKRQRIEEKAMKAPVKMLVPMLLFIFPSIFLVLLGPAIIQLKSTM
ncbi:MAG: type II secretion system F family protein [Solirubrobacterales bacterium]